MHIKWPIITFIVLFFLTSILIGTGCSDGWSSSSIGSRGACSHHGGVSHKNVYIGFIAGVIGAMGLIYFFPLKETPKPERKFVESSIKSRRRNSNRRVKKTKKIRSSAHEKRKNPYTLYNFSEPKLKDINQPINQHKTISKKIDDSMPSCPICGSRMQFKDKKNYGFNFWGCINYPSCKGIRKEN